MKQDLRGKLGRPPVLTGALLTDLCVLLADGHDVRSAAAALKVARATVYNTINRPGSAGGEITAALEKGRAVREEQRHGTEACATRHGCRRPECVKAASAARAARRRATAAVAGLQHLPAPLAPDGAGTAALYELVHPTPLADAS